MPNLVLDDDEPYVAHAVTSSTTGPFAIPFPVARDYVGSIRVAIDGEETEDYAFTPGDEVVGAYLGGALTLDAAVANCTVEIWRDTPITRSAAYAQGPLDVDALNAELLRVMLQLQDARLRNQRSELWTGGLSEVPISATMTSAVLAESLGQFARAASVPHRLTNIAALRAASWAAGTQPEIVILEYSHVAGDGGGLYRYKQASSTDDGGMLIATATGLQYQRQIAGRIPVSAYCAGNALGTAWASLTPQRAAFQAMLDYAYANGIPWEMDQPKRVYGIEKHPTQAYGLLDRGTSGYGLGSPDSDYGPQIVPLTGYSTSVDIVYRNPEASTTIDRPEWRRIRINPSYSGSPLGRHSIYVHYNAAHSTAFTEYLECRFGVGNDYALKIVNVGATNPQGAPFRPIIRDCYLDDGLWLEGVADSSGVYGNIIRRGGNRHCIHYDPVNAGSGVPQKAHLHVNNIDGTINLVRGYGITLFDNNHEVSSGTNDAAIIIGADCEDVEIFCAVIGIFNTASLGAAIKNSGKRTKLRGYRIDTAATGGGFTAPTYGIRNESGGTMTVYADESYLRSGRFGTDISDAGNGIRYVNASPTPTGAPQEMSGAGAISLLTRTTKWSTTGAQAATLADGVEGQRKLIVMAADGGDGTLTPTNFGNGTTITFNDVGDTVELEFTDGEWWLVSNIGCTVA